MSKDKQYTRNKRFFKSFLNLSEWVDYERIKEGGEAITTSAKRLFLPRQPKQAMTFEESMKHHGTTEQQLQEKIAGLKHLSILMIIVSGLISCLSGYQFTQGNWYIGLITLVFTGLGIALAFRYHFWYFQLKQRRLGCSFGEWVKFTFRGQK